MASRQRPRFLLPLVIVAVFLVSGCVNQTPAETADIGTNGLVMSFFQGAPPFELGEGEEFEIGVNLENLGDILLPAGDAEVYLRGVNPNNFGYGSQGDSTPTVGQLTTSDLIPVQTIDGETIGGQDALVWSDLCYEVDLNTDQTVTFIAQSCYIYNSTSRFDACFNENPYKQTTGTETCIVEGFKTPINSNSPVQVTSIAESPAGLSKFRFIVKLANLGNGKVYDSVLGTACTSASVQDLNRVYLEKITFGAVTIPFDSERITSSTWLGADDRPYVKIVDGEGQFSFTYQPLEFATSVYTEPVEFDFSYGYTNQISTSTTISAIPGIDATTACSQ